MSQLNYLAIMCDEPTRMRDWYARWFGMEEYNRTSQGTIYMSDGHLSVGLLQRGSAPGEDDQNRGVHHFGFQIDDIMEIERNLEDFDPSLRIEQRPSDDPYAQYRVTDPEGIVIDLSERGYGVDGDQRIPGIRHLATCNVDLQRKHDFYLQVLGMRNVTRTDAEVDRNTRQTLGEIPAGFQRGDLPVPFAGDGFVNLAILRAAPRNEQSLDRTKGRGRPSWFDHFGMLVPDPLGKLTEIRAAEGIEKPLDKRPAERQVEYGVPDPEGNVLDLSGAKGWKVDVDKWARVE
jgi:catechol 2,3-dioxygenase-like lactoylglutathione lyase family enzyme